MILIQLDDEQFEAVNAAIALYNRVIVGDLSAVAEQIRAFKPFMPEPISRDPIPVGDEQLDRIDGLMCTASVLLNRTQEDLFGHQFNCKPTGKTFTLTLQETNKLIAVIDLYVRIGLGQIDTYVECLYCSPLTNSEDRCILNALEENARIVKRNLGFDRGASWGVTSVGFPEKAKIAYDVECVVRQVVARLEQQGAHSVWHRSPLHTCKRVPLAVVSETN